MSGLVLDLIGVNRIRRQDVLGLVRDRASVNEKACRQLMPLLPSCTNLECICHGYNNSGGKFVLPITEKYLGAFNGIIKNSQATRLLVKEFFSEPVERYSVRWFSQAFQTIQQFRNVNKLSALYSTLAETNACPK